MGNPYQEAAREKKVANLAALVRRQFPRLTVDVIEGFTFDDYQAFAASAEVNALSPETISALKQRLLDLVAGKVTPAPALVTEDGDRPRSAADALVSTRPPVRHAAAPSFLGETIVIRGTFVQTKTVTYEANVSPDATFGEMMDALMATAPLDEHVAATGTIDGVGSL